MIARITVDYADGSRMVWESEGEDEGECFVCGQGGSLWAQHEYAGEYVDKQGQRVEPTTDEARAYATSVWRHKSSAPLCSADLRVHVAECVELGAVVAENMWFQSQRDE